MNSTQSPLKLGQVFSHTFALYGKDFWKMFVAVVLCMLVMAIPAVVLVVYLSGRFATGMFAGFTDPGALERFNPAEFMLQPDLIAFYAVLLIVGLAVSPFLEGMVLHFASSRLKGRPLSLGQAFTLTAQKYGRLLLTMLSAFLLALPLIAAYMAVYFGTMNAFFADFAEMDMQRMASVMQSMTVMSLFGLVFSVVMTYLGLVFMYSNAVVVNEQAYGFTAVFGSFRLVHQSGFWKNIGHYIVMGLALSAAGLVLAMILSVFMVVFLFAQQLLPGMTAVLFLLVIAFVAAVTPFPAIFVQNMYYNSRIVLYGKPFDEQAGEADKAGGV